MTPTDHYAEAEQLLVAVDEQIRRGAPSNYVAPGLAAAQVHATLATVQRGEFERAAFTDSRTIPWPPSEELMERVAGALSVYWGSGRDAWKVYVPMTRAVLDAIGGEA